MDILGEVLAIMVLAAGGAAAVVAFLWLATFSWFERLVEGVFWLMGGMLCASVYFLLVWGLAFRGPISMFLSAALSGLVQFVPPMILEGSNKNFRRWALYVVWLYFWVTVLVGWQAGWLGLAFITLPALLVTGLGLFFVAGFILPSPFLDSDLYRGERPAPDPKAVPTFDQEVRDFFALLRHSRNRELRKRWFEHRRSALRCLVTYTLGTNYPYYVVVDEKIRERTEEVRSWLEEEERRVQRVGGDPFGGFLAGPGIVLTDCDHAVALSTGLRFKGAKGPGVVFTGMSARPEHVVDLRVQLRAFPVRAWTKDGIEVKVTTFIPFQIGTGKEVPALGKGFPYRSSDVFKAVCAQLVEHVGPSQTADSLEEHAWYDLPQLAGERIVREAISRYEFDDLYEPFELRQDAGQDSRSQIARELREGLDRVLPDWGIQRIGGGIGNLEPVAKERVIDQRIEAWRADWTRKIMRKRAEGQFRRIRLVEQARAQAQIDIILSIGKRIESLRSSGAPVPMDAVVLYFVEVLEQLADRPALRKLLPRDTGNIIQLARGTVGRGPADEEGE